MKELDPETFRRGAKELERQAAVVREAMSIIDSMPRTRARKRKSKKTKEKAK